MASSSVPTPASTEPQTIKGLDASFEFTQIVTVYKYIHVFLNVDVVCSIVHVCTIYIHLYNVHVYMYVAWSTSSLLPHSIFSEEFPCFRVFADVYVHVQYMYL